MVEVNGDWLDLVGRMLDADGEAATIDAALRFVMRAKAAEITALLSSVDVDFTDSHLAWRYGGGRDLSKLVEKARSEMGERPDDDSDPPS